jgi:hypothetical protein
MSPDTTSYLDVGSAFYRHDWFGAFNAYWSPLYAWTLGVTVAVLKPSPKWEFPVAHAVNFGIFLVALFAFRFFLRSLTEYAQAKFKTNCHSHALPDWTYLLIGYVVCWWCLLEVTPLYELTPDLAVAACMYFASGLLLRGRRNPTAATFVLLGLTLGIGYWTKAALFPLAIFFLAITYLWNHGLPQARLNVAYAVLVFVVVSAPLIFAVSAQEHRITFGDSGRLNYAWAVAPRTFWRNWQGEEPGSGAPLHPTQILLQSPRVYAFDGPVVGTYPPWLDPSYWNEGLQWHFALRPQLEVVAANLMIESSLLLRSQPALLAGVLILALLSGAAWWPKARELWPLIIIPIAAFAMYVPVHVEPRFLGGFVLILFLTLIAAALPRVDGRAARAIALALFVTMSLGTADATFRYLIHRVAIPGSGPNSVVEHVTVANEVRSMGLSSGDKVAIIGDGTRAYWARLASVHIVAEIMTTHHDAQQFWLSPEETKQIVYKAMAGTGAKLLVADNPPEPLSDTWIHVRGTSYYLRPLSNDMHVK